MIRNPRHADGLYLVADESLRNAHDRRKLIVTRRARRCGGRFDGGPGDLLRAGNLECRAASGDGSGSGTVFGFPELPEDSRRPVSNVIADAEDHLGFTARPVVNRERSGGGATKTDVRAKQLRRGNEPSRIEAGVAVRYALLGYEL